jgi:hypothetical protein
MTCWPVERKPVLFTLLGLRVKGQGLVPSNTKLTPVSCLQNAQLPRTSLLREKVETEQPLSGTSTHRQRPQPWPLFFCEQIWRWAV